MIFLTVWAFPVAIPLKQSVTQLLYPGCLVVSRFCLCHNGDMEEKPVYKTKTGPASFEEMYGEPYTALRFKLPERQLAYLKAKALKEKVSIADYLRQLIERDMVNVDPATQTALARPRQPADNEGDDLPY